MHNHTLSIKVLEHIWAIKLLPLGENPNAYKFLQGIKRAALVFSYLEKLSGLPGLLNSFNLIYKEEGLITFIQ